MGSFYIQLHSSLLCPNTNPQSMMSARISSLCFFFFFSIFLISSASAATKCSSRCLHQSKAAYFTSSKPLSSGACGYGSIAPNFNNGYLAAGVPSLFKAGVGCGDCFHIRCKNERLCRGEGTNVILTDIHKANNETDFVLSDRAFISMASKGMARELLGQGIIDVEYRRIPCVYQNQNLSLRVENTSKKPNYLAVTVLYQGGQTEIQLLDVLKPSSSSGSSMHRNFGAVWDVSPVPEGPLLFRLFLIGGYDRRMVWTKKGLPADWKAGEIYDLGDQINDVVDARDGCSPCTT